LKVLSGENMGKPIFEADFNQDGKGDWAVLVINDKKKEYRVYYVLREKSEYHLDLLFTRHWKGNASGEGPVSSPMFLKPVDDPGISEREYNSLIKDDVPPDKVADAERIAAKAKAESYKSGPAIEVWTGTGGYERSVNISSLAYCSQSWYYEHGALKTITACD
jgi:hypothetical protein